MIATLWALAGRGITCGLIRVRTVRRLEDNVRAAAQAVPPEIVATLKAVTKPVLDKLGDNFDYYESLENNRTQ